MRLGNLEMIALGYDVIDWRGHWICRDKARGRWYVSESEKLGPDGTPVSLPDPDDAYFTSPRISECIAAIDEVVDEIEESERD